MALTSSTTSFRSGFTLLELIVVMAIIGILAMMTVGNFQSSRIKANDARRKSDLKQIQAALEQYHADFGNYPASGSDGTILGCGAGTTACSWGSAFSITSGAVYMNKLPSDLAPQRYFYVGSASGRSYQLFTALQNTRDNDNKTFTAITPSCVSTGTLACTYGVSSSNVTIGSAVSTMP